MILYNIPFIKGILIGFAVSIPVGPIGLLCIQQTLTKNRLAGLIVGLGAATSDILYGIIGSLGLNFVSDFFAQHQFLIRFMASLTLCYLGVKIFLTQVRINTIISSRTLLKLYFATFLLTTTNPLTLFAFTVIFAGMGVEPSSTLTVVSLVSGIFLGSTLWWFMLSNVANIFRSKISLAMLQRINSVGGTVIVAFGVILLLKVLVS
jgi:threonine/homoserine/homoserine lactone efflux protein